MGYRRCDNCWKEFWARSNRHKRCPGCARITKFLHSRNYNEREREELAKLEHTEAEIRQALRARDRGDHGPLKKILHAADLHLQNP
jgi:hypothetical protein